MIQITKLLKSFDQAFEAFISMPKLLIVLFVMTLCVLHIPIWILFSPEMYTNEMHSSPFFKEMLIINNLLVVMHIGAATPAIVIGPYLLAPYSRKKTPNLHRFLGKIYVLGCIISALTIFPVAISNRGGLVAVIGFGSMSIVWFTTTFLAYTAIRNKDFVSHRRWIMRSYAMTFAFVHVNLTYEYIPFIDTLSVGGQKAMQSMVSWQFNLLLVELYLEATSFKGKWQGFKKFFRQSLTWSNEDRFYGLEKVKSPN